MPSPNRLLLLVLTGLVAAVLFFVARGYPPSPSGVPPAATVVRQPGPPPPPSAPAPPDTSWPSTSWPAPSTPPASPPTAAPPVSMVSTVSRVPDSPTAVAEQVGGFPAEWSKGPDEHGRTVGDNGWIHRGMQQLHFRVPEGCVVDTDAGRLVADAPIDAANFTMYWL